LRSIPGSWSAIIRNLNRKIYNHQGAARLTNTASRCYLEFMPPAMHNPVEAVWKECSD
jgi:hypothetical protein